MMAHLLRLFTSHYVSINSLTEPADTKLTLIFTSHYVSINSRSWYRCEAKAPAFTSHYVSINSAMILPDGILKLNLHPTMYLLIPNWVPGIGGEDLFTSHYVSINSRAQAVTFSVTATFTSHYVSINSYWFWRKSHFIWEFTSHYVSINSVDPCLSIFISRNLHPTMYLLIPYFLLNKPLPYCNLHPTMYLLIHTR